MINTASSAVKTQEFKKRMYTFILKIINSIDTQKRVSVSKTLTDQLMRSSSSILANYVEGLSSSSKRELQNYFNHSLKSANETKLWIALLRDSKRIPSVQAAWFLQELDEYSKIFAASILTLKGKRGSNI